MLWSVSPDFLAFLALAGVGDPGTTLSGLTDVGYGTEDGGVR
jgi:hypothetical protein